MSEYCLFKVLQAAVRAYHNFEFARLQHIVEIVVVELQHIVCNLKPYHSAFALLKVDTLKALQLLYRAGYAGYHIVYVQLYYLIGIIVARILYCNRCRTTVKFNIAVFKCGLAKSETERIERIITNIKVIAAELSKVFTIFAYRTTCGQIVVV